MVQSSSESVANQAKGYAARLADILTNHDWTTVEQLTVLVRECWSEGRMVFVAGNGGSAANAIHWANDFVFPIAREHGRGLRIIALTANPAVVTCLANDAGYDSIFARQIDAVAQPGDLLIVLSGSGNSANIVEAIRAAKERNMKSVGIFGFSGGKCRELVDVAVHFEIHDMQIAEDLQLVVNHIVMQALRAGGPSPA